MEEERHLTHSETIMVRLIEAVSVGAALGGGLIGIRYAIAEDWVFIAMAALGIAGMIAGFITAILVGCWLWAKLTPEIS